MGGDIAHGKAGHERMAIMTGTMSMTPTSYPTGPSVGGMRCFAKIGRAIPVEEANVEPVRVSSDWLLGGTDCAALALMPPGQRAPRPRARLALAYSDQSRHGRPINQVLLNTGLSQGAAREGGCNWFVVQRE
jgi:hypothetical protein